PSLAGVDWGKVRRLARANRLTGPVFDGLDRAGLLSGLPEDIRKGFEADYLRQVTEIRSALALADDLAARFAAAGVGLVVLRGLALGLTVYPRPFLRSFSDLDLLVLKTDLPRAKTILREAGLRPAPGTFPEGYFERHHLHLPYHHPPTGFPVELHWALDHPYTLSRVDYPALLAGRRAAAFESSTIPVLGDEDRLITLGFHLGKHVPFLPELLGESGFPALLLRGGWLLWVLDIRQVIMAAGPGMDWNSLAERAGRWNLEEETAACLRAAAAVYPEISFPGLPPARPARRPGFTRRELYRRQLIYLEKKRSSDRFTRFLFGLQGEGVFRPVRILDLGRYLFPGAAWLKKRRRNRGIVLLPAAIGHTLAAAGKLGLNVLDYLYCRLRPW
ncbi:MAG: nucleotidyltransferase family protein, partial [Candidatus Erginobacter occultus]|nr:nucleotidyltransferase family protein [Candidatus Erginobacter occultus]